MKLDGIRLMNYTKGELDIRVTIHSLNIRGVFKTQSNQTCEMELFCENS